METNKNYFAKPTLDKVKLLTASFLTKNGFKLVDNLMFDDFVMDYYARNGIILFFNKPVTKYNKNDFYVGYAEMRCGEYKVVAFRWVKTQEDLIDIYEAVTGEKFKCKKV